MHYSREVTANRAPGQPLILTASGSLKSTPVVENVEVAAAAGGRGGQSDDDVSGRADRKRKAPGGGQCNDDGSNRADRQRKAPGGGQIKTFG